MKACGVGEFLAQRFHHGLVAGIMAGQIPLIVIVAVGAFTDKLNFLRLVVTIVLLMLYLAVIASIIMVICSFTRQVRRKHRCR